MKHKVIFISVLLFTLLISFVFAYIDNHTSLVRYHQHKQIIAQDYEDDTTKLPIIKIDTNGVEIPGSIFINEQGDEEYEMSDMGEKMITAGMSVIDQEIGGNHMLDQTTFQSNIQVRYRGNSSRRFTKKGYLIRLIDEQGQKKKAPMLGMTSYDEWVLHGPFLDKTLMRNYLCMNVIGQIMPFTPDVRFVQLYVDDEFQGLYLMEESIGQGEGRVNITKTEDGDRNISYIIRMDKDPQDIRSLNTLDNYTFMTIENTCLSIVYPGASRITTDWQHYIEQDFSKFEKALFSYDFQDPMKGYRAHIDVDSFVDYYVFMEFFGVRDIGSRSTYLYKDAKGKICMGPVWDFNNAMDNFFLEQPDTGMLYTTVPWFQRLLKDEYFVKKVVNRYHELRKSVLGEQYLLNYIDEVQAFLGQEIDRNFTIWGYSFDVTQLHSNEKLRPDERNPSSYEQAVNEMKEFITVRGGWLDEHIETLYQYAHESKNKDALLK